MAYTVINLCSDEGPCARAYLRGGVQGVQTPPPEIFRFFLKSEGKEIERKRKKGVLGGGGFPLNIFLGLIFFRVGLIYFHGGLRNFREGLRNFRGGVEKISGGGGG